MKIKEEISDFNPKELQMKIVNAMERIESLYYETKGKCYLSFSGGKDSTVVLALIKMCQEIYTIPSNAIPAVFCETGLELGATSYFVRWIKSNYYPNVIIIRPDQKQSFHWIINHYGKPVKSKIKSEYLSRYHGSQSESALNALLSNHELRNKSRLADKDMHMLHSDFDISATSKCCKYLKKIPFERYSKETDMIGYMTGLRKDEGGARALNTIRRLKEGGKICTTSRKGQIVKMPIIDWTDQDVDTFISMYKIKLSDAYTLYGCKRTGCFLCPYSLTLSEDLKILFDYEPNRYKAAMYWLKDVYIAQNVILSFDLSYERERKKKWETMYWRMRYECLLKYRPEKAGKYTEQQLSLF